ncbi:copper chaperone PCu(A)C [Streptomyces sp. TRM66268-LWL]|uniref:Copper chaperone PCu(A)C n=1 Tax=Streptomyces polyasparticus TaxID=2767826 RepID=A0ABR7SHR6_9ACTN|nr:copper chaperone PCu(A)C [Streptomyces polyasparticus]MBC9714132.1 copper chaperone PCu(A)C [Streptomyces polyasparticus]
MRRRAALGCAIAAASALVLGGCSGSDGSGGEKDTSGPELSVRDGFMPKPALKDMAGGFLTIVNKGGADKLIGMSSPLADEVMGHRTVDQKMEHVASFDIPANGELDFERGGNHLMFMDLKSLPELGDKVEVELRFEKAGTVKAELEVKEATYNPKNS